MTAPTTSIAWDLVEHLTDSIGARLTGQCRMYSAWPGDKSVRPEMVWCSEFSTTSTVPVMTAGRKRRDEEVTITWAARVAGRRTIADGQRRMLEIKAAFEEVFAGDPTLGEYPGVTESELTSHSQTVIEAPDSGPFVYAEFVTVIQTRLD